MIQYVSAVIHGIRLVHGKDIFLDKGDVLVIEIETPDGGFDLIAAAKAAALEYCKTEGGKEYFCTEKNCFNWASFAYDLPPEFCERHGFKIISVQRFPGHIVDWRESLASVEDVFDLTDGGQYD